MKYNVAMARSTPVTTKYAHYWPLYDLVVADLPVDPTVIEIGIANGGSLQDLAHIVRPTSAHRRRRSQRKRGSDA